MNKSKIREVFDAAFTIVFSILLYLIVLTEEDHSLLFDAWSLILAIGAVSAGLWVLFTINQPDSWEDEDRTIPSEDLVMQSALGRIFFLLTLIMANISDLTMHSLLWGLSGFFISMAALSLVSEIYNFTGKELHLDLKIFKINIVPRYKKEREEFQKNIDNIQD